MNKEEAEKLMKKCQIGVGGHNVYQDCHDLLAECYGAIGALDCEIRRLRDALKKIAQLGSYYAQTPQTICIAREALGCKKMPYE